MNLKNTNYCLKKDIKSFLDSEKMESDIFAKETGVSINTIKEILNNNKTVSNKVYEKIYDYIYSCGYRINTVKEEFLKERSIKVLFHGSKEGLNNILFNGSRDNCDFGKGFYLGDNYDSALSFICDNDNSSAYSFSYSLNGLKVVKFDCSLEWMLAICYYRGTINRYANHSLIKKIIRKIENSDVIIAPIADNRMFYIMSLFANGDINSNIALHSLSASNLGVQYVFRSEKAIKKLKTIEKYYICNSERNYAMTKLKDRSNYVDSKLKMSRREFKKGLYIEELLK